MQHQIFPNEWSGKFKYEQTGHPQDETMELLDLTLLCYVSLEDFSTIARLAESLASNHSFYYGWQVQTYVMALVSYLCRSKVIDVRTMSREEETRFDRICNWLDTQVENA